MVKQFNHRFKVVHAPPVCAIEEYGCLLAKRSETIGIANLNTFKSPLFCISHMGACFLELRQRHLLVMENQL